LVVEAIFFHNHTNVAKNEFYCGVHLVCAKYKYLLQIKVAIKSFDKWPTCKRAQFVFNSGWILLVQSLQLLLGILRLASPISNNVFGHELGIRWAVVLKLNTLWIC